MKLRENYEDGEEDLAEEMICEIEEAIRNRTPIDYGTIAEIVEIGGEDSADSLQELLLDLGIGVWIDLTDERTQSGDVVPPEIVDQYIQDNFEEGDEPLLRETVLNRLKQ